MVQAIRQRSAFGGRTTGPVNSAFVERVQWAPYAGVWNSADKATTAAVDNNGFKLSSASGGAGGARGTLALSGRVYWSVMLFVRPSDSAMIGILPSTTSINTTYNAWSPVGYAYGSDGTKLSGTSAAYGAAYVIGDLITVAVDVPAGSIWFAKNGVWQASGDPLTGANPAYTGLTGTLYPWAGDITATTVSVYVIAPPAQSAVGLL